jgi:hypothetical protein
VGRLAWGRGHHIGAASLVSSRAAAAAAAATAAAAARAPHETIKMARMPADELEAMDVERILERPEDEVQRLIVQLENSVAHLQRSNVELEEFMAENGNDKELRTAIGENIVVIARRRAILEDLRNGRPVGGGPGGPVADPLSSSGGLAAAAATPDASTPAGGDPAVSLDDQGGLVL